MWLADLLVVEPDVEPDDPSRIRGRRLATSAVTIVVAGALLGATLRVEEGSTEFTVLGLLAAGTWIAGAVALGPIPILPSGRRRIATTVVGAAGLGAVAFVFFLAAYHVAQHLPGLSGALDSVLDRADAGSRAVVLGVALINGIAEGSSSGGSACSRREASSSSPDGHGGLRRCDAGDRELGARGGSRGDGHAPRSGAPGHWNVVAPIATHLSWSTLMILLPPADAQDRVDPIKPS